MHRNGHLWTSGQSFDIIIRFLDPDFLITHDILAIWGLFCWFLHWISWMSAIFLLPAELTYWPRKCVMRCAPHGDSFHQDTTIRYLVIALLLLIRYVTLWSFDFGQWSYMAGHVFNPSTEFEDLRLSVLELWVLTCLSSPGVAVVCVCVSVSKSVCVCLS